MNCRNSQGFLCTVDSVALTPQSRSPASGSHMGTSHQLSGSIRLETKCIINAMHLNHLETFLPTPYPWEKNVFHKISPWCQEGCGPLHQSEYQRQPNWQKCIHILLPKYQGSIFLNAWDIDLWTNDLLLGEDALQNTLTLRQHIARMANAIVSYITERFCMPFIQFSPSGNILQNYWTLSQPGC